MQGEIYIYVEPLLLATGSCLKKTRMQVFKFLLTSSLRKLVRCFSALKSATFRDPYPDWIAGTLTVTVG